MKLIEFINLEKTHLSLLLSGLLVIVTTNACISHSEYKESKIKDYINIELLSRHEISQVPNETQE